jgi:hypothetical protein
MTPTAWMRAMLDAAEKRGWSVVRFDVREGVVIEEPIAGGLVLRISGRDVDPAFILALPEARQPA